MTLNSAIQSALSGLSMASRATMTIASNVANATTEGYGRRDLELVARDGNRGAPGVMVVTERRIVDAGLVNERRLTDAALAETGTRSAALHAVERAFGVPGAPGALATRVADFTTALTEAASRPDSLPRLDTVLRTAQGLAGDIAGLGRTIQSERSAADTGIGTAVDRLNDGLAEVQRLNRLIQREIAAGQPPNGLIDQRQRVIDGIADLVPLREVPRPGGQINLYTTNGAVLLLDGRRAEVGFAGPGGPVEPGMSLADGTLRGLTLDGRPIFTGPGGPLGGGQIDGLFAVRDGLLADAQTELDILAADLITRFETADGATPVPGIGGLFTDAGASLGAPWAPGLAQRLSVSPRVDPAGPDGELWRLRTGLGGAAPGLVGDARGLDALARALEGLSGLPGLSGPDRDFAGHAAELGARLGRQRDAAEVEGAAAAARNTALLDAEASGGVDTDAEMQRLLTIERLYAANARVLMAVDEMMQRLLAI